MNDKDLILGLFYSDEDNLIYERFSQDLSDESEKSLRMLSYKFLGPLFFTAASGNGSNWKIESIEYSLSQYQNRTLDVDVLQSFFSLNSSINTEYGWTNLSALIGSPYTEDINLIYRKMVEYIHPSIIQGKFVAESIMGGDFKFKNFIQYELERGLNLIEYTLGSARKLPWEEQQNYYCIGIIERINNKKGVTSNFYSFDKEDSLRKFVLPYIPSFYVMSILPDYYEKLINEALVLFNKTSIFSNIKLIKLSYDDKKVQYLEEFIVVDNEKRSYGVILIPELKDLGGGQNLSFYKRNLRFILDTNKELNEILFTINPQFVFDGWSIQSEDGLNNLKNCFDC